MRYSGKLLLVAIVILVIVMLYVASDSDAAATPDSNSRIELSIVSAPFRYSTKEVLNYRMKVRNLTNRPSNVELYFQLDDEVAPQKGPVLSRKLSLRASGSRIIDFRASIPSGIRLGDSVCLTVSLYSSPSNPFDGGIYTCARPPK